MHDLNALAHEADVLLIHPDNIPWAHIWPTPSDAHGDGSAYAESVASDGTPGTGGSDGR